MLYRTDDFTRWGAGKGTNLEPVEIDANFWELAERLVAVEGVAGDAANGIANIGVVGSQMTVYLQDGTPLGPYTLPTAMIRYRGDWTAATAYLEMDLVTVPGTGVYLVLVDHTSDAATFDALAEDAEGSPLYRFLFPMGTDTGGGGGASSVAELTDVDLVSEPPVTGQTLVYYHGDGSNPTWYPGVPSMGLDDLDGVFLGTPSDGQVLTWVAADSAWRSRSPTGGGATTLDGLTDVTIAAPATGHVLRFDGTAFVNAQVAWGDIGSVPATFAPSPHSHPWSEITDRPAVVDALPAAIGANGQVLKVSAGAIVWGTDDTGGGTGSGASVSDEGSQILAAPTDLNFAGAGVTVTDDGDGTITITIPGGGGSFGGALDDLSDVTIASPATGQFLRYDGAGFVNAVVDWSDLANKPATFAPDAHTHAYGDLTGIAHQHPWSDLTGVPAAFAPEAHTHPAADIDGAVIETIADATYTQVAADDRKWKRTTSTAAVTITIDANVNAAGDEITFQQGAAGQITFAAGAGLTLTTSGSLTSGGQGAVVGIKFLSATEAAIFGQTTDNSGGGGGGGGSGDMTVAVYDPTSVGGDAFSRTNHHGEQAIATVTGLQAALDAKAPTVHTHVIADLTIGGTPDGTKFLRDDGTWASVAAGLGDMTAAVYDPQGIAADAFARASHTGEQAIATITGLQAALDGKAATVHTHLLADIDIEGVGDSDKYLRGDGWWGTISDGQISGLQAKLDAKAEISHIHTIGQISNLSQSLDAKAAAEHTHPISELETTGTPSASTFLRGDGSWQDPAAAGGAMTAAVYDPQGLAADAFARGNHTGTIPIAGIGATGTPGAGNFLRGDGVWAAATGDLSGRNWLINGNFDHWQRGTSLAAATATSGRYLADRWIHASAGSTVALSRQAFALGQTPIPMAPKYFMRCVVASVAGSNNYALLGQRIEDVRSLAGQTVTVSFWAKGSTAGLKIGFNFMQHFGTGGGSSNTNIFPGVVPATLTTSWQKFSGQMTVNSIWGKTIGADGNDYLLLRLYFDVGSAIADVQMPGVGQQSGTFDIAQIQLEPGAVVTPFDFRHQQQEAAMVERYYQEIMASARWTAFGANERFETPLPFRTLMRTQPTGTITGTGTNMAASYPQLGSTQPYGSRWYCMSAGAGDTYATGLKVSLDAEL